jgi:hypothetical protein
MLAAQPKLCRRSCGNFFLHHESETRHRRKRESEREIEKGEEMSTRGESEGEGVRAWERAREKE